MYRLLLIVLLALPAAGETKITSVEATPQQLVTHLTTDQPGNCAYRVSEGVSFVAPVNDVNETLFRGSSSDARAGSLIEKNTHTFVAGARIAQKAADNKWYSRSLQTNTPHWIAVKCGADAEVSAVHSTTNKPLGNTWAEPYPFDEASPLGYSWPTVDFTDKAKSYVDPETGVLLKRLTGIEQALDDGAPVEPTQAAMDAFAVKSGDWRNAESGAVVDSRAAVSNGATPLFVALSGISINFSTARLPSWNPNQATEPISNIKVRVTGSGTGGASNTAVCLTVNGVSCATDLRPITLPAATRNVDYPAGPMNGYFSEWIGSVVTVPPNTFDMATFTGTVSVAGNKVSWKSGHRFNVGAWTAGSHIKLTASAESAGCTAGDYTIAAVDSETGVTLNVSAGNCAGAAYTAANFGVLVFPINSSILSIDGVRFTWDEHPAFTNPPSGANDFCNRTQVSDATGAKGWICYFSNTLGAMSGYFLPTALDAPGAKARHLWSQIVPSNADASIDYRIYPEDQTRYGILGTFAGSIPSDASDANSFYALAKNEDQSKISLIKGTYFPAGGRGKCNDPAGYLDYAPPGSMSQNCNVTWVNLTRASSRAKTLTDRLAAFDPRFDPKYFSNVQLVGVRNGMLILSAWTQQDFLGWEMFVDAGTAQVVSMWPSYTNFPTRWGGMHAFLDQGDRQNIPFVTQNLNGCDRDGCGPYQVGATAANALTAMPGGACGGVTDPKVKDLLARGEGCVELTLSGMDACDPDPSPYEQVNFPACSWNGAYRGLKLTSAAAGSGQKIAVGDVAFDIACTGYPCEQFLVGQLLGGNRVQVLRNFGVEHGALLDEPKVSALRVHAANFTLRFTAGLPGRDCEVWGNFVNDHHGENLRCDVTYHPTAHSDHMGTLSVLTAYYGTSNRIAYSIRTGPGTALEQVGKRESLSVQTGISFGGVLGGGHHLKAQWDSHPSYRQVAAPPGEQQWFLDMVRMGIFANPLYTGAKVTHVNGSLYRIAGFIMSAEVNVKYRPLLVWSGRHNVADKSGPKSSITGDAADNWRSCYAYLAGECVPSSAQGSMFMNVPSATADGTCTPYPLANSLCVNVASPELDTVSQIGFAKASTNGEYSRTLAVPFRPWFNTNSYANVHATPDGTGAIFTCDWCLGVRSDMWWAKVPPTPAPDNVNRADYVKRPVTVAGAAGSLVRIRFGYAENGPPESLFCTTRHEACATDASGVQPFLFLSEAQHFTRCDTDCVLNIPAVPGRVVYYVVDRQRAGVVSSEALKVLAVN